MMGRASGARSPTAGDEIGGPVTDAVNRHVGRGIRAVREDRGISLADLAAATDVSAEQLGLCEAGEASISALLLYQVSRVLEVPVDEFFEGLEEPERAVRSAAAPAKRRRREH